MSAPTASTPHSTRSSPELAARVLVADEPHPGPRRLRSRWSLAPAFALVGWEHAGPCGEELP
jgi:hypothetical protein